MNFRSNKGFSGIDISISLIILLTFIPTMFGIVYNIQRMNNNVNRETEALSLATNILEIAKSCNISDVSFSYNDETKTDFEESLEYSVNGYTIPSGNDTYGIVSKENAVYQYIDNDVHYKITINIEYPKKEDGTEVKQDYIKKVNVNVEYPTSNTTKSVEISTLLKSV